MPTTKKPRTPSASLTSDKISESKKKKELSLSSITRARKTGARAREAWEQDPWRSILCAIPGYDPLTTREDCRFVPERAQRALDFFPGYLTHVKGGKGGTPFELEPWQVALTANIFGWIRPDGMRRYRTVFLYVPRKNGKTPWAAGVLLYLLLDDDEPGMELYSAATDKDQAALIFQHAKGMVLQDHELNATLKIYEVAKSIVFEQRLSSYKVISHEAKSKHGYNSHGVVVDELHAQPDRELVDVLVTSTGARRQPLVMYTTTSDYARPSICNEKYDYACKVRDGILHDPTFLPVIYEAPQEWEGVKCDYLTPEFYANEAIWAVANPNLGISLSREYMRQQCRVAQETPAFLNTFLRLHLNIRTQSDVAHYSMPQWDACQSPDDPEVFREKLRGRPCYAGLDLASTSDLCALVLLFPEDLNAVLAYFWLPEETALIRERRSNIPYPAWVNQRFIKATPGNVADYDVIREDILALSAQYAIKELAYDRWNATHLVTQLTNEGILAVGFGQGFASMSAPMKELDKYLAGGELRHDGNPVARWCMSNVMADHDAADNFKPSKSKSSEKIDFTVALLMAIGRAIVREEDGPSIYETRGMLRV
jgi:phage terminase large subunit-like protein